MFIQVEAKLDTSAYIYLKLVKIKTHRNLKAMFELEGTTLGHYQLQRRIARGGMSEVYLAYDQHRQHAVAIKVVHRSDDEYVKRFQRELKVLSTITHPHILPTLDYGEQGPWCYFVMPYIAGG